jgi:hypothetical protein
MPISFIVYCLGANLIPWHNNNIFIRIREVIGSNPIRLPAIPTKGYGEFPQYTKKNLRHYATNRKVAGLRPDEVNDFFSIYVILPAAPGPGVYSASNRKEYQKQKNNVSGE